MPVVLDPALERYVVAAKNSTIYAEQLNKHSRQGFILYGRSSSGKTAQGEILAQKLNLELFNDPSNVVRTVLATIPKLKDFQTYLNSNGVLLLDEISSLSTSEYYGHLKMLIEWQDEKNPQRHQVLICIGYKDDYDTLSQIDQAFPTRFQYTFAVKIPSNVELARGFVENMQREYGITFVGNVETLAKDKHFVAVAQISLFRCAKQNGGVLTTYMDDHENNLLQLSEAKKGFQFIAKQKGLLE